MIQFTSEEVDKLRKKKQGISADYRKIKTRC